MEIIVLGSGTSVPHPDRKAPAHLVKAGDTALLLDAGSGCSTSMVAAGVHMGRLDALFLSHFHPDHTADLVPLLFCLANPVGPVRTRDLPLFGPVGLKDHHRALQTVYGRWIRPREAEVVLGELRPGDRVTVGDVTVSAFPARHSGHALVYRVEAEGRVLCYSGDTEPCDGVLEAARGADLLLCECALGESDKVRGHMRPSDVGRLASRAGCGRVVLCHLYGHPDPDDRVGIVKRQYAGPVELAVDGEVYRVRDR